jgi:hypothetical protein
MKRLETARALVANIEVPRSPPAVTVRRGEKKKAMPDFLKALEWLAHQWWP